MHQKFFRATNYKGVVALTIVSAFTKVVSVLFKIIIIYIIGTIGIGYYQLAFPLFVFAYTLSSVGNATALTMVVAGNHNSRNKSAINYATIFTLVGSIVVGIAICLLSTQISSLQGNKSLYIIYMGVATTVVAVSVLSTLRGAIRGYRLVKEYAIADIIEQITRLIFSVLIAWLLLPYGLIYAVFGVFLGITLSACASIIYSLITLKINDKRKLETTEIFNKKEFWIFAVLTCITSLILPFTQFIDSTIVVRMLEHIGYSHLYATKLFGLSRGTVSSLLNLPNSIILAIEVLLLPDLVRLNNKEFCSKSKNIIFVTVFVSSLFSLLFLFFSKEILTVVYGAKLEEAELQISANLLKVGAIGIFFSALSQIQATILQGKKMLYFPIISLCIASVVKIVFEVLVIPQMGIVGAEISNVLFYLTLALFNSIFLYIKKLDFGSFKNLYSVFTALAIVLVLKGFYILFSKKFHYILSMVFSFLILCFFIAIILFICKQYKQKREKTIIK